MPMEEFIKAIQMIVNSTFFTFNNKIYEQVFGTPMDSPLSSVLADIVLQDIEEAALGRLPASLPFYYRYVDNILLAPELFKLILETFNSFHDKSKFIMEIGEGGRISFLDVTLIVENRTIIFFTKSLLTPEDIWIFTRTIL